MAQFGADFGGSMPEYYDRILGPAQFDAFAADIAGRLPAKPPGPVLEIACGTGRVTAKLRARLAPEVRLVASDLSEQMLGYARSRVPGDIEWQAADASALPFEGGRFAATVCSFGIMFVPDKNKALSEMRRVLADGGTLLLDEIGEMPFPTQAKLLRVLEDSKVRRLGSKSEISVDVRVLAATNKVPEEAVAKGQLRSDLYFRLNVVQIPLPPLRAHMEDLEDLTAALLNDLNRKHSRAAKGVESEVLQAFRRYNWPGNVRELRNVLERMLVTCSGEQLTGNELPRGFGHPSRVEEGEELRLRPGMTVAQAERRLIFETLASTQNNKTRAAELLGISLKTLHNKLKEYGAQPED